MTRLALHLGDAQHFSPPQMIELAQAADRSGYEAIFTGETWGWDVGMLLSLLAERTSTIRLGADILNIFARTPSAIAQHAATLDILSGGRAILGLGIATPAVVQDWHGVPFDRPAQRIKETVEIIRQALSGQRLDYQGDIFRVQRFRLTVRPVQERIPILLGTNRARNVELTGRIADGWSPGFATTQTLAFLRERLAAGAQTAGRDPAEVTIYPIIQAIVTDDPEPARRLLRRHLAYYFGSQGSLHTRTLTQAGIFLDELARIQEAWAKDSRTAERVVPEEMVDAFMLVGSAAECRERLAAWHAAGAHVPTIQLVVGTTFEDSLRTVEALGTGPGR